MAKKVLNVLFYIYNIFIIFEILLRVIVGEDKYIYINLIKILLILMFVMISLINKKTQKSKTGYMHFSFILIILIFLIKIMYAQEYNSFVGWLKVNNNVNFILYYLYFLSIINLEIDLDNYKIFIKVINYIVVLTSFILFYSNNYMGMVSEADLAAYAWVGTSRYRMMSVFGNPNHAGLYFLIMLCILDYFRLREKKSMLSIINILLIICNILTFSRTSIIIMIIYYFIRNMVNPKNLNRKVLTINKMIISIIIVSIVSYLAITKYNVYFLNLNNILTSTRVDRWSVAIQFMKRFPIIGTPFDMDIIGMSSSLEYTSFSDNMFLEIGSRFGILPMVVLIIMILKKLYKVLKNKSYFEMNKLQILVVSCMLSGAIHFNVPLFLFIIYSFKLWEPVKEA